MILLYMILGLFCFYGLASLILIIFFPKIAKGVILAPFTFLIIIYYMFKLPKGKL